MDFGASGTRALSAGYCIAHAMLPGASASKTKIYGSGETVSVLRDMDPKSTVECRIPDNLT